MDTSIRGRGPFAAEVEIPVDGGSIRGDLQMPAGCSGVVLFAHGSGSSRLSPRNRYVATELREAGLGTLLMDLLTPDEERGEEAGGMRRFDIELLTRRLLTAAGWLDEQTGRDVPLGLFGASTGAAAALMAAAAMPDRVRAVVSRGGRPDLADVSALERVAAPTLLIVGGHDRQVLALNRAAARHLRCPHEIRVIPGATHLFEEPGALEDVAGHAREWLERYLSRTWAPRSGAA